MKKPIRVGDCTLYCGDSLEVLKGLEAKSVHCCVTSPPYFGLRDYKTGEWKGGDPKCKHSPKTNPRSTRRDSGLTGGKTTIDAGTVLKKVCHCGAVREDKQIGLEDTPEEYTTRLVAVFHELRRVLRDDGTLWVNLGDSYSSGGRKGHGTRQEYKQKSNRGMNGEADPVGTDQPPGLSGQQLIGVPWMFAEAMRRDGWLLRMEITWVKLSAIPESVQGWRWERCRVCTRKSVRLTSGYKGKGAKTPHGAAIFGDPEDATQYKDCPGCDKCEPNDGYVLRKGSWRPTRATESIFLFAKSDRYYCDGETVKQRARDTTVMRDRYTRILDDPDEQFAAKHDHETLSGGTANLRNWVVFKGEPLKESHYASFPSGLPKLAIKAGTSQKGVCPHCGAPWARVVARKNMVVRKTGRANSPGMEISTSGTMESPPECRTLGWRPTCKCPEHEPVAPTVLDPFVGSGTTLLVCEKAHINGIGIDLSEEYIEISRRRIQKAFNNRGFFGVI